MTNNHQDSTRSYLKASTKPYSVRVAKEEQDSGSARGVIASLVHALVGRRHIDGSGSDFVRTVRQSMITK